MTTFLGGSAYSMATGIAEGYHVVNERTFRGMTRADLDTFAAELERHLREVRGDQAPLDDLVAIQHRARRIQRLNTARMIMSAFRARYRT